MTVTITGGAIKTFTFTKSGPSAKFLQIADLAARYFWEAEKRLESYDDLTPAQKLALLDMVLTRYLRRAAWEYNRNSKYNAVLVESEDDFDMG